VRADRLALGTLCEVSGSGLGVIVGTWSFTRASGTPGTVETRERRFRADPQTDETAQGYLLLPSEGTGFFFVPFGAVHTGDITALS
jgi:hypothetical protein